MRWWSVLGILSLGASALTFLLAPLALSDSYSWVTHTTSEAAAQGVEGSWVARSGFLLFGLGVLAIAQAASSRWGQPATLFLVLFAVTMFCVAAFSSRSWEPAAEYNSIEDQLHSVAATVMGFAFAFGVVSAAVYRRTVGGGWRLFDAVAVVASVALPLAMASDTATDGSLQRMMFAVAFAWFVQEAVLTGQATESAATRSSGMAGI